MQIIEQQYQIGNLIVTWEVGKTGKTFTVQDKGGDVILNNIHEDEVNLDDLIEALNLVKSLNTK